MKNVGTQRIVTDRLVLRRFTVDDAENMFYNWASDPEVTKYLRWPTHTSVDVSRNLLTEWQNSYLDPLYYSWAIVLENNNTAIGSIGIIHVDGGDESGEVGYAIGKAWWGNGFVTEALKAVILFGFEQAGFNRLEAFHSINNPASGKVMQHAGMIFEGVARQKYKANLGFQDCNLYSILKCDFQA